MLKSNKVINNISPEFLKEISQTILKRGEVRQYVLINMQRKGGAIVPPNLRGIKCEQTIIDPHTNLPVLIGAVKDLQPNDGYKLHDLWFTRSNGGSITLVGNNPEHVAIDLYLQNSSENAANTRRDPSVNAVFTLVDPVAEANEEIDKMQGITDALVYVNDMSDEDLVVYAYATAKNPSLPVKVLRASAMKHALSNPGDFLLKVKNNNNQILANARRAEDLGIIGYDNQRYTFFWQSTNTDLTTVPRIGNHWELFTDYLQTNNGKKVYEEMKRLMAESVIGDDGLDVEDDTAEKEID